MSRDTFNLNTFYTELVSRPTITSVSPVTGTDQAAQNAWVDSTVSKLDTATTITSKSATDLADYITLKTAEKVAQQSVLATLTPGTPSYQIVSKTVEDMSAELVGLQSELAQLKADLAQYKSQRTAVTAYKPSAGGFVESDTSKSGSTGAVPTVVGVPETVAYVYNAPMVSAAYHRSKIQLDSAATRGSTVVYGTRSPDSYIVDPWNYSDAMAAWNGYATGGKGAIQMSRKYSSTWPGVNPATKYRDDTLYGFRFMYNPTNVTMNWGVSTEVSPQFESMAADVATAMTSSILNSTIDIELVLNRIEDFDYIDQNGLIDPGVNPYPGTTPPDPEELKKIYEKGTMYDVEYLLRVLYGKSADYMSVLNGLTADRGYLTGWAVELHLGKNLRYLVRIGSMGLSHSVFNSKMVPLLTTLRLTCTRYPDFAPDSYTPANSTAPVTS